MSVSQIRQAVNAPGQTWQTLMATPCWGMADICLCTSRTAGLPRSIIFIMDIFHVYPKE